MVIVYNHKNKESPISGNSSPFKLNYVNHLTLSEEDSLYDFLHVNIMTMRTYEYANIYFNENTLRF